MDVGDAARIASTCALKTDAKLKARLPAIEKAVADGTLSPALAVEEIARGAGGVDAHDHVLITGFGRFPGAPFNPSGPLARAVAKRRRPAFADVRRVLHIFETSYAAVDRDLPKLIAQHKPDIVLMFGLAGRTPFVRIETRARNARSILFPDVTGYRPDGTRDRAGQAARCAAARRSSACSRAARASRTRYPAVARCRALSLQLRLLARAGGVPIRHAARAVHPYPAGRRNAAAAGAQARAFARGARARRRGHFAGAARRAAPFSLMRCPAAAQPFLAALLEPARSSSGGAP